MDKNKIKRVRAILLLGGDGFALIRREKPNEAPYYVFPGGGVDPSDESLEFALQRELNEELGVSASSLRKLGTVVSGKGDNECFFYAESLQGVEAFVGAEQNLPGRGTYRIVLVRNVEDLADKTVLPENAKHFLEQEMALLQSRVG